MQIQKERMMSSRMARLAALVALAATTAVLGASPVHASAPGRVTLLFSRTEVGGAQACTPDDDGVATLLGTVEPYMAGLGLTGTGTLNTDAMGACTHGSASVTASWAQAGQLVSDGWSMDPHLYMGLAKMDRLTPQQAYNETCGQATAITANLGAAANSSGMISYPGLDTSRKGPAPEVENLQTQYGQNCFSWARSYGSNGLTTATDAATAPYWQHTESVVGYPHYTDPETFISQISSLQPGQWLTIQAYVLVTGVSPSGSAATWDCTSPVHTTSDPERYCWTDYQKILNALSAAQANGSVAVTDPLSAGAAMARLP